MFKTCKILILAAVVAMLATGCDFFRKIAGRPTSEDIAAKVERIRAEARALEAARLDSLRKAEKHRADSIAVMDSIRKEGQRSLPPERLGGLTVANLPARYYLVVGAFVDMGNEPATFSNRATLPKSSFPRNVVAVGNKRYHRNLRVATEVKRQAFCPSNVWILTNE